MPATIVTGCSGGDTALEDYVPKPVQAEKVRELLLELEMAKLLEKLKLSDSAEAAPAQETHAPEAAVTLTEAPLTAEVLEAHKTSQEPLCCLSDGQTLRVRVSGCAGVHLRHRRAGAVERSSTAPPDLWGKAAVPLSAGERCDTGLRCTAGGGRGDRSHLLNPTTTAYEIPRLCVT